MAILMRITGLEPARQGTPEPKLYKTALLPFFKSYKSSKYNISSMPAVSYIIAMMSTLMSNVYKNPLHFYWKLDTRHTFSYIDDIENIHYFIPRAADFFCSINFTKHFSIPPDVIYSDKYSFFNLVLLNNNPRLSV